MVINDVKMSKTPYTYWKFDFSDLGRARANNSHTFYFYTKRVFMVNCSKRSDKTSFETGQVFYSSRTKWGRQLLHNRLLLMIVDIEEPWLRREMSDEDIRILMKKSYVD